MVPGTSTNRHRSSLLRAYEHGMEEDEEFGWEGDGPRAAQATTTNLDVQFQEIGKEGKNDDRRLGPQAA